MGGYWLEWLDGGCVVAHQVFRLTAHLCYWWSMDAGGFVVGLCPT